MQRVGHDKNDAKAAEPGEDTPDSRLSRTKLVAAVLTGAYLACLTAWILLLVVWQDGTPGNPEIFLKKSTNGSISSVSNIWSIEEEKVDGDFE